MTKILTIDQGTTSSRALIVDADLQVLATDQREFTQYYPHSGWVEHDAEEIWSTVISTVQGAMAKANVRPGDLAGIGITNQRETVVIWDRDSGQPIHPAIVWQDRRTGTFCDELKAQGHEAMVTAKTGLLLDPYFSATKVRWLLDHVDGAREKANQGKLAFGTIDCFLLWRLTGGAVHATDASNAARTMLYNIHDGAWDADLLALLDIPASLLPEVKDNACMFGKADPALLGGASVPILGMAGDQQAATIGQACFEPGMLKSTYGTGCFALLNTGDVAVESQNRLLTTIAYRLDGKVTYALEGSIFIAGAAVQWLRDGLKILSAAPAVNAMAEASDPEQPIIMVPAFVGLGAPYWDSDARGAIYGLGRNTGPNEFARAALEAVSFQTRDLIEAMRGDWAGLENLSLRVDGGMAASDWTMQRLADVCQCQVQRPVSLETTALGAAYLAGLQAGVMPSPSERVAQWQASASFEVKSDQSVADADYARWTDAVQRTLSTATVGHG